MTKHLRLLWVTLLMCVCTVGGGFAQTTVTLKFTSKCNGKGTDDKNGAWVITSDGKESNFVANGIHYGTSSASVSYINATTNAYSDKNIKKIVVNASTASKVSAKVKCTVGGNAFGEEQSLTTSNKAYNFEGNATGDIVVSVFKPSKANNALYLLSVEVTYDDAPTGTPTTTTFGSEVDGKTFVLEAGKLNGEDFALPTTATADVAGSIAYTATGDGVVTSEDNVLTLHPDVYGTSIVKATFTPTDNSYASSSASYTVTNVAPKVYYTTFAAMKESVPTTANSTANAVSLSLNLTDAIVTKVNGKNTYMQDASTGVLCYDCSGLQENKKYTGKVDVKACWYSGVVEITSWTPAADMSVEDVAELPLETVTIADLCGDNYANYEFKRVQVLGATVTTYYSTSKKATIEQGDAQMTLYGEVSGISVTKDNTYDFIGVPYHYKKNSTDEWRLGVFSNDDITEKAKTPTTLSFDKDVTEEFDVVKGSESAFVAPKAVVKADETVVEGAVVSYKSSNTDVATVDAEGNVKFVGVGTTTITASYAGDATYAAATSVSYTINYKSSALPELPKFAFKQTSYEADLTQDEYNFTNELDYDSNLADASDIEWTVTGGDNEAIFVDGTMVFTKGLAATYTITATFKGNENYAPCEATCELVVKNLSVEEKTVEFVAGTDKGATKDQKADQMVNEGVTISSTTAAFGYDSEYRFYGQGITTISTRMGTIKAIEFISKSLTGKNTTKDFKLVDGEPGEFTATTKSAVWSGPAKEVKIRNNSGSQIQVSSIKVTVEIPVAKSYTLDQTSESNTLVDYDNANVTINRKIGTDGWYTLCLPFSLTESETKTYFGDDVNIRTFDSMEGTVMNFKKVTAMEAGKPYLVKTSTGFDGTTTPFEGVQLKAADPDQTSGADGYKMQGIYNKTKLAIDGSQLFLGDNNKFFKPSTAGNTMKGFRVYFEVPMVNGKPMNLSAANIDGVETALTRIDGETVNNDTRVFNLQGQCLGTSLSNLPSGIYVQGGKKVVVK